MKDKSANAFKLTLQVLTFVFGITVLGTLGYFVVKDGIWISSIVYYAEGALVLWVVTTLEGKYCDGLKKKQFSPTQLALYYVLVCSSLAFGNALLRGFFQKHDRCLVSFKRESKESGEPTYDTIPQDSLSNRSDGRTDGRES